MQSLGVGCSVCLVGARRRLKVGLEWGHQVPHLNRVCFKCLPCKEAAALWHDWKRHQRVYTCVVVELSGLWRSLVFLCSACAVRFAGNVAMSSSNRLWTMVVQGLRWFVSIHHAGKRGSSLVLLLWSWGRGFCDSWTAVVGFNLPLHFFVGLQIFKKAILIFLQWL